MKNYEVIEIIDGLKIIDEISMNVMLKCEKEFDRPFSTINWLYVRNQVKLIKMLANEVEGQNYTDDEIVVFLDKERRENGNLKVFREFFESKFESKKKTKTRKAKRKK